MNRRAITEQAKDAKREAILCAALDEFFDYGFRAAKMESIACRLGASKGTLYLYFGSKEEIFEALIQTIALPKINLVEQSLMQASSVQDGLSQLFAAAPNLIRHSSLPKVVKVLISDAFAFPKMVEHYRNCIVTKALNALTVLLATGCKRGEISLNNPALTAKLVVAPVVFSIIWTVVFESQDRATHLDVEAFIAEHQHQLFRSLGLIKEKSV